MGTLRGLGLARQLLATMSRGGPEEPAPKVNGVAPAAPAPPCERIAVTGAQEGGPAS
ncbi:hypothetical protein ACFVFH_23060 [Streptomyces sp. NPDC057697]|uniref:hypothetical protein n=1 Tax=Streptomyces sp. NPDC057697 TaxID=3346219 RepID=UPI00368439CC